MDLILVRRASYVGVVRAPVRQGVAEHAAGDRPGTTLLCPGQSAPMESRPDGTRSLLSAECITGAAIYVCMVD